MTLLLLVGASLLSADSTDKLDYNRDIRPILSDKCFYCHGPDPEHREADLRLDTAEGATADLGDYHAIVPGDLEASEAIYRITTDDEDDLMPPPKSGKSLTKAEIDLLKKWVSQGAEYEGHWAFTAPKQADPPEVQKADWVRNPIDNFVLAQLQSEDLAPSPEASKETLVRRVTLDLTGLPPTPSEVDNFLKDDSPSAWDKVVDRLLSSERYGERMALDWLNAARYADTHGYQADNERFMWIWRDWVINAFNENKPFDEFTIEQIAGDMLPEATLEQKIASGFNRNHRINGEGGVIAEEYRVEYVIDRLETTGTVWLGLTLGCARCHSHKFDPVSHEEFYQFFAYFNNVPENGRDGRRGNAQPAVSVPIPGMQPKVEEAQAKVAKLKKQLSEDTPEFLAGLDKWATDTAAKLEEGKLGSLWEPANVTEATSTNNAKFERLDDNSFIATGANPPNPVYTFNITPGKGKVSAIRLEALTHKNLTKGGLSRSVNGNFVLTGFEVLMHKPDMNEPTALKVASAKATYSQDKYPVANAIDGKKNTGWAVLGRRKPVDTSSLFTLAKPLKTDEDTTLILRLRHDAQFARHAVGRLRFSLTSSAKPVLGDSGDLPPAIELVLRKPPQERDKKGKAQLAKYYRGISKEYAPIRKQLAAAEKALADVKKRATTSVMVMKEMEETRPTFILNRGLYDQPGEQVSPGIPATLGNLPKGAPNNRLGLAQWLVDPSNPLTARVTVNRFWQHYFGTGLVKTVDDFGAQGDFPSHPDLLDWLATEFIRSGWDMKAMQKLIVTSATYRQATAASKPIRERDPANRLLSRGPRFRLSGPVIRDQALAVSGLLDGKVGGPSVKPYQPAGLWADVSGRKGLKYTPGKGGDLYRRSMYTYWKRAVNPPTMIIFDQGGRERCDVATRSTNTPSQALATLNDVQFVEAARFLAERMILEGGEGVPGRLSHGWQLALARQPDSKELATLQKGFQRHLAHFKANPEEATKLLAIGEKPAAQESDPIEHAAYTAMANLILNLDETITHE